MRYIKSEKKSSSKRKSIDGAIIADVSTFPIGTTLFVCGVSWQGRVSFKKGRKVLQLFCDAAFQHMMNEIPLQPGAALFVNKIHYPQ